MSAGGQLTIITDPFDKKTGLNPPRGNADIITISHKHPEHNNIKTISGTPFVINSPGEYGIKNISIKGIEKELNTIYIVDIDKIKICHLGAFKQEQLSDKQIESIGQIDILMTPVNNAGKIIEKIEPSVVIPMHYTKDELSNFLKEMGISDEDKKAVDKLSLKKKDIASNEMEIVIMKM